MDNRGQNIDLKRLVNTLRRVTTAVQILPFIYSSLYIAVLLLYNHASDNTLLVLDSLFYVSPVVIISFLLLSRVLRLCCWHKTACVVPAIPQAVNMIDYFVISFEDVYASAFNYMILAMVLLLLVAAYKVFFK